VDIYKKYFSEKLTEAIKASGLSQSELAEKVGVAPPAVSRWVTGKDMPSDENFKKIVSHLGIRQDFFLGKEAKIKNQKEPLTIQDSVEILSLFACLSPLRRQVVFAILREDASLLEDTDPELAQCVQLLSKDRNLSKII